MNIQISVSVLDNAVIVTVQTLQGGTKCIAAYECLPSIQIT